MSFPENGPKANSAELVVLKKLQGGVWAELARTAVCATPEWIEEKFGAGEYELRLNVDGRMIGMYPLKVVENPQSAVNRVSAASQHNGSLSLNGAGQQKLSWQPPPEVASLLGAANGDTWKKRRRGGRRSRNRR